MNFFRKATVPVSNETKEIDARRAWGVRWMRRKGKWHTDTEPMVEVFLTELDALNFRESLYAAWKLTKNTCAEETSATVQEMK